MTRAQTDIEHSVSEQGCPVSQGIDCDRAGSGPPINHLLRLKHLLLRRAEFLAAGYHYGSKIDRVLRYIDCAKGAVIAANRDNPDPPF
jgi:hypothetical protein